MTDKCYKNNLNNNKSEYPKLYRYVPLNYNNLRLIEKSAIKLTPGNYLNDFFEAIPICENILDEQIDIEQIAKFIKIKSFTENNNDLLMWSFYADGGKGVCIEYELERLDEESRWILEHLYPVNYHDIRCKSISEIQEIITDLFYFLKDSFDESDWIFPDDYKSLKEVIKFAFYKAKEWEQENEWRIIISNMRLKLDENIKKKLIKEDTIYFNCISRIYCGVRIDSEKKENIKEIVLRHNKKHENQSRKIKLYEMTRDEKEYMLKSKLVPEHD